MLNPNMVSCWKKSDEVWNPVSSCIVFARLKLCDQVLVVTYSCSFWVAM